MGRSHFSCTRNPQCYVPVEFLCLCSTPIPIYLVKHFMGVVVFPPLVPVLTAAVALVAAQHLDMHVAFRVLKMNTVPTKMKLL